MQNTLRAVIYVRVSTDDQADFGTGLETQSLECKRIAERIGATVVNVESDPGVSGTLYPRPGIDRALMMLETGQADLLIAYNPSRLGRKVMVGAMIWERIQATGRRLFLSDMGEVTTKNEAMFFMGCTFAQHDWRTIIENMNNGKRRLAERGRMPCRSYSPYGYHIIQKIENGQLRDDAGTFEIVEAEAEIVRRVFALYESGHSLSIICRMLQDSGVPIPRQDKQVTRGYWQPNMVARILQNTAYKGYVRWGKTRTAYKDKSALSPEEQFNLRNPKGRKKVITATPEDVQVRIEVPRIIEDDLWETCQRQREENKWGGGARNDLKHLFTGLVLCPNCGRKLNSAHNNTRLRQILYRCRDHARSQNSANIVCNKTNYKQADVRAALRRCFKVLVETPEFFTAALRFHEANRNSSYSHEAHEAIRTALRELDRREAATAQAFASAIQIGTPPAAFEKLLAELAAERKRLEAQDAAQEARRTALPKELPTDAERQVAEFAADVLAWFDSDIVTDAQKNLNLRRVLASITPTDAAPSFEVLFRPMFQQVLKYEAPVTGIVMHVTPATGQIRIECWDASELARVA